MRNTKTLSFLLCAALLSAPAFAAIKWRGDFETGDLSQYGSKQMVAADRIQVVSNPVKQGSKAIKVTVIQGDDPINASGNRNELVRAQQDPEGSDVYYRWQTMFAANFPSVNTWQLFAQWHQPENYGSPPLQFQVIGEEIQLTLGREEKLVWKTPMVRGHWLDFIFHVKFSDDASVGFVELWYNGQKVLPKTFGQTRANTWMKLGLYRNETVSPVGVVYHDGMVLGDTFQDVADAGPALPGAPAPTPAPTTPAPTTPAPTTPAPTTPPVQTVANVESGPMLTDAIDLMPYPGQPMDTTSNEPTGTGEQTLDNPGQQTDDGAYSEVEGQTGGCNATGAALTPLLGMGIAFALSRRRRR